MGEAQLNPLEGLINTTIFTYLGMSGSPLFVQAFPNDECYVVGIHFGRIKNVNDRSGGLLLNEKCIAQI